MGEEFGGEWIHVYVWLNPFSGHRKLSQCCESTVLLLFSHLVMCHSATPWTTALQASLSLSQSVQSLSHVRLFVTPWTAANKAYLSITDSRSLLKLLCRWCHPTITSSDALFSFCPLSFLASATFPMSWLFASGDQNTGASASASVLPTNVQGWFSLGLNSLISWLSTGLSGVFSSTIVQGYQFFGALPSFSPVLTTFGKSRAFTIMNLWWRSNVSAFQHTV